jgi:hypothetical protein
MGQVGVRATNCDARCEPWLKHVGQTKMRDRRIFWLIGTTGGCFMLAYCCSTQSAPLQSSSRYWPSDTDTTAGPSWNELLMMLFVLALPKTA